jgi:hypothetical protein
MNRFGTLMQREWMQHRTGWLVVMGLPVLIFMVAGIFGTVDIDLHDTDGNPPPLAMALGAIAGVAALALVFSWFAALLQTPGLARRDVQDRSIEFWLSLPIAHWQSLAATLLMHLLVVPWTALLVGLAGGLIVSLPLVIKMFGAAAWFTLPWHTIALVSVAIGLRLMAGVLLATLWMSPLILGTMAASAWLKRWGVPAVIGSVAFAGLVLDKAYGNPIVWQVLGTLGDQAGRALIAADRTPGQGFVVDKASDLDPLLQSLPGWALHDLGQALLALASPAFVLALAGGAAGFALLWLRRQRGA